MCRGGGRETNNNNNPYIPIGIVKLPQNNHNVCADNTRPSESTTSNIIHNVIIIKMQVKSQKISNPVFSNFLHTIRVFSGHMHSSLKSMKLILASAATYKIQFGYDQDK